MANNKELPHAIPALQDPARLADWVERRRKVVEAYVAAEDEGMALSKRMAVGADQFWVGREGQQTYETEFAPFITTLINTAEKALEENAGKIKLVSFGGGKMEGMLTLRAALEEGWHQKTSQQAHIEIVDFSLSKGMVTGGGMKEADHDPEAWKNVTLHIGPIELRDLTDVQEADIMLSMFGPFKNAEQDHLEQLLIKTLGYLRLHGRAFFHIPSVKPDQAEGMKKRLSEALGQGFQIRLSKVSMQDPYIKEIQLLDVERVT